MSCFFSLTLSGCNTERQSGNLRNDGLALDATCNVMGCSPYYCCKCPSSRYNNSNPQIGLQIAAHLT